MEKKEKKEQTKCPICGRFVRRELAEKYDALLKERDGYKSDAEKYLRMSTDDKRRIIELTGELESIRAGYDRLIVDYNAMCRRGFWARVFNKSV